MAEKPELPADYRCPLCPSHLDDQFIWHDLAEACVCFGCQAEIDCGFDFELQPTMDDYHCADTIERLLAHLGVDYGAAKARHEQLLRRGSLPGRYVIVPV
jgi:hypothetical protein